MSSFFFYYCASLFVISFYWQLATASLLVGMLETNPNLVSLCHQAMDDAKTAGQCVSDDIQIMNEKAGCDGQDSVPATGTSNAGLLFYKKQVQALIGSRCSQEAGEIGRLAYFWKLPMLNRAGSTTQVFRRELYPTTIHVTDTSVGGLYFALSKFIAVANQTSVLLAGRAQKDDERASLICGLQRLMMPRKPPSQGNGDWNPSWECRMPTPGELDPANQPPGFSVTGLVLFDESDAASLSAAASNIRTPTKLVVIAVDGLQQIDVVLQRLQIADIAGTSSYLFVVVCASPLTACLANAKDAAALRSILISGVVFLLSPTMDNFAALDAQFSSKFGNSTPSSLASYKTSRFMDFWSTYQACYGFCVAAKQTPGGTSAWMSPGPTNPAITAAMRGQSFTNSYGTVQFDNGPAAIYAFAFQYLTAVSGNFTTVYTAKSSSVSTAAACTMTSCFTVQLSPATLSPSDPWSGTTNKVSTCEYASGLCWTSYLPYVGVALILLVALVIIGVYAYVRRKRNLDLYREHWKIPKQQIKVIENKASKGKPGATVEVGGAGAWSKRRILREYALIGNNKAEFIALRQLKRIIWDKEDLQLIYELKKQSHDNLCVFLGISYNNPDVGSGGLFYMCHALVERGSLEDYINDHDFQLDKTFQSAFLRDILKGIQYLHKSPIGYHGLLNLQTVLIDSNWVLKLTNFGIVNMLNKAITRGQLKLIELIPMTTYLTVAPENLSDVTYGYQYPNGNAIGDIYAFGMMLYHILYRQAPFDRVPMTPREILDEVKRRNLKPTVDSVLAEERPLVEVMELCWHRNVELRPKLRQLSECIQTVFQASQGNLIDQMRRMNEKHALNLENLVAQRTEALAMARSDTEKLLHEMLPKSIATQLKERKEVQPRSYESVTVLFCQIVDFSMVLKLYKADLVINFLNRVFSHFDNIIRKYDAYKVETTGETYMVASGVPNENGQRHVFEISELALEMRDESHKFGEWALPEFADWNLKLKIGYHCGPIAAGVIGFKAPRYCLFGDTVNFASRMQSTSPANQIQMAESTALILMQVDRYRLTKRGIVKVKGKGEVNTYWLNEHLQSPATAANEDREHSHPLHQQQQEPGASVTEQQVSGGSRLLVKRKNSQLISPAVAVETKEIMKAREGSAGGQPLSSSSIPTLLLPHHHRPIVEAMPSLGLGAVDSRRLSSLILQSAHPIHDANVEPFVGLLPVRALHSLTLPSPAAVLNDEPSSSVASNPTPANVGDEKAPKEEDPSAAGGLPSTVGVEGGNTNSVDSNYDSKETSPNTAFKRYHRPLSDEDGNGAGLLALANVVTDASKNRSGNSDDDVGETTRKTSPTKKEGGKNNSEAANQQHQRPATTTAAPTTTMLLHRHHPLELLNGATSNATTAASSTSSSTTADSTEFHAQAIGTVGEVVEAATMIQSGDDDATGNPREESHRGTVASFSPAHTTSFDRSSLPASDECLAKNNAPESVVESPATIVIVRPSPPSVRLLRQQQHRRTMSEVQIVEAAIYYHHHPHNCRGEEEEEEQEECVIVVKKVPPAARRIRTVASTSEIIVVEHQQRQ